MEAIKILTEDIRDAEEKLQSLLDEIEKAEEDLIPIIGSDIKDKQFELNAIMKERETLIKEILEVNS